MKAGEAAQGSAGRAWVPSRAGAWITRTPPWRLVLQGERVVVTAQGTLHALGLLQLDRVRVEPGRLWATVVVEPPEQAPLRLAGLAAAEGRALAEALAQAQAHALTRLLGRLDRSLGPIVAWVERCRLACTEQLRQHGWLARDFIAALDVLKPRVRPPGLLEHPAVAQALAQRSAREREAVAFWRRELPALAERTNERHLAHELRAARGFLDTVEKSPLTEEQARAVLCLDNRVLLVAAAGSGKTATLVAKAAWVVTKGYVAPERILMLAFNREAATELSQRVQGCFTRLGLPTGKVATRTFHAFGLDVIAAATGRRPALAPWLETGRDAQALLEVVDLLKDRDPTFRANWDLFRLVLAQDLPRPGVAAAPGAEGGDDRDADGAPLRTLAGETVRRRGEQLLANWLFYNGIEYRYAAGAAASEPARFFLPALGASVVLSRGGAPAAAEAPGAPGADAEPVVLNATEDGLWDGEAFRQLARLLVRAGVALDPNPDRPLRGRPAMDNERLARTFRAFLAHAKGRRLSVEDLRRELQAGAAGRFTLRHRVFLSLFERIRQVWEARLRASDCIDHEDMLNLAADCLEAGRFRSPFALVMVDEFQDASPARARLIAALVKEPGRQLFAVGDDWQGINRFAGAELALMTDFESHFGPARRLQLNTTFRCPQSLCDVSSAFVMRNPQQLRKAVVSARPDVPRSVRVLRVAHDSRLCGTVAARIAELEAAAAGGEAPSVLVLGRYNSDRRFLPTAREGGSARVSFLTVHAAKGREADHVIVPALGGALGFPSRMVDDPVLRLAMPPGDDFELAEERRLFYVALTRARVTVTLLTVAGRESAFVQELVAEHGVPLVDMGEPASGAAAAPSAAGAESETCPACGRGHLVARRGRRGPFEACTAYPECRFTRDAPAVEDGAAARRDALPTP